MLSFGINEKETLQVMYIKLSLSDLIPSECINLPARDITPSKPIESPVPMLGRSESYG